MRYVFDTNVIVSAFLFDKSRPAIALQFTLENEVILLSQKLLEEITEVLTRKKFKRYIDDATRIRLLEYLVCSASIVKVCVNVNEYRDPKDNQILELALSGKADYIITGDLDLLTMNPFQTIEIITVEQFLRSINQ